MPGKKTHPGLKANGRLKKGFSYDKGGKIVMAKPKKRTKLYRSAKALGSAGGKVTARKRKQQALF